MSEISESARKTVREICNKWNVTPIRPLEMTTFPGHILGDLVLKVQSAIDAETAPLKSRVAKLEEALTKISDQPETIWTEIEMRAIARKALEAK